MGRSQKRRPTSRGRHDRYLDTSQIRATDRNGMPTSERGNDSRALRLMLLFPVKSGPCAEHAARRINHSASG